MFLYFFLYLLLFIFPLISLFIPFLSFFLIFFQYFLTYVVQISSCSTYCTRSKLVLYLCSKTRVSAKGFPQLYHT